MMPNKKFHERLEIFGNWMTRDEVTQDDDNYYIVRGKACVIGQMDTIGTDFDGKDINEIIDHGAFDNADLSDVVLNVNHGDGNYAVARTRNNTLSIDVQEDGVYVTARLKKGNPRCEQYYEDISEGLLDRMSFKFTLDEDKLTYNRDEGCWHIGAIKKVYDVSAVEFPAYKDTSIQAKSEIAVAFSEAKAVAENQYRMCQQLSEAEKLLKEILK